MKRPDKYYDLIYDLAHQYRKTEWWEWRKRKKLLKEIHLRWLHFVEEISNEQDTSGSAG